MIRFPDGGHSLNIKRALPARSLLFLLILAALLLSACGGQVANANWPGLSTDGQLVYLAGGPEVAAYDIATQERVWSFPEEPQASLQFFAAPSISEDQVVFGDYGAPGGFFSPSVTVSVYAVENVGAAAAANATPPLLWTNSEIATDKIVAPPLQVDNVVYVGTADNFVYALDAESGAEIWGFETGHSIWGQPAYRDGVLLAASMDRALHALDAETGEELWEARFAGALPSEPVLNEGLVYVSSFDSQVHALDIQTGEQVWSAPDGGAAGWVWGAPAYSDGVVYFADITGIVYAVDSATGAPLWQAETAGAVQTSPVVAEGVVYVASEGELAETPVGALTAFDAATGDQLWQQATPAPLFTTPVVVDNAVIVALQSEEAVLSAFDRESGARLWFIAPVEAS